MSDTHPPDFFVAGGTLKGNAPSYVERPADEELYQAVRRGEFCYVLTARQMGKSSLMARTARRLQTERVQTAIIDLTQIGTVAAEQWYFDFVSEVAAELDLDTDVEAWWQTNASQGIVRRFTNFLRDVVLTECESNVVIFVDEIDFTLSLNFADDFFAAIRAVYNNRSRDVNFERLTFVLMGVAAPSDLVKDQTRTPFNVGRRVALNDFSQNDMLVLEPGIEAAFPRQGKTILSRIYYWTQGHPYLTQKLGKAVVSDPAEQWASEQTDQLVDRFFLRQEASKEDNLAFVRNFVLNQGNRRDLLRTYRQVWQGKEVVDSERSPVVNQLKLAGLVKTEGGYLHNRNEIYRRVFNEAWIRENTAIDWTRVALVVVAVLLVLVVGYGAHNFWQEKQVTDAARPFGSPRDFREMTPVEVCERLYLILHPHGFPFQSYESQGLDAFYAAMSFDASKMVEMFEVEACAAEKKTLFIATFYDKLAYTDWSQADSTLLILEAMAEADTPYRPELEAWVEARRLWREGELEAAQLAYDAAINLNENNAATRWERGRLWLQLGNYEQAAVDLQQVMVIAALVADEEVAVATATATAALTVTAESLTAVATSELEDLATLVAPDEGILPEFATGEILSQATPTPTPMSQPILGEITARFSSSSEMALAVSQLLEGSAEMRAFLLSEGGYPELQSLLAGGIRAKDGMQMVAVSAGTFTMGSSEAEIDAALALCEQYSDSCSRDFFTDEAPAHAVQLAAFEIDQTEVTNAQFAAFLSEQGNQEEGGARWLDIESGSALIEESGGSFQAQAGFEEHPVIMVTWYGSNAYCQWVGGQLPTEAQWEYAARSSGGNIFPWGDDFEGTRLNYCDNNCEFDWKDETVDDGYARTAPVGSYPAGDSWVGAQDMAGNVWEWTADWYEANYYESSPINNPTGPAIGDFKVLRGGSWYDSPSDVRGALRLSYTPDTRGIVVGFRCVVEPGS